MFTAPDEHMRIIQLHIMSTQPPNKAAEHLISAYLWLVSEKETEAVNAYLHKQNNLHTSFKFYEIFVWLALSQVYSEKIETLHASDFVWLALSQVCSEE